MNLNDLMIKKKKRITIACFPQQFEQSKVEWSIYKLKIKIFFPDAFEGRERLGSIVEDGDSKKNLQEMTDTDVES